MQDNMKPDKICPKCKKKMIFIDDSFDYGAGHHGSEGTEIIKYWLCEFCDYEDDEE